MTVTPEEVRKDISEHEEEWMRNASARTRATRLMTQVHLHGEWLGYKLRKEGATGEELHDACFAFGQRMCAKDPEQYPEMAASVWNRWLKGDRDKPGRAFGEALVRKEMQEAQDG